MATCARPKVAPEGPPPANAKFYDEVKSWIRIAQRTGLCAARSGAVPIFMGGDHSLSMGSVNGVARYCREQDRPLFVLWLDAHADYNTPDTTLTGNMHGMSGAFLCGEPASIDLLGNQPRASITPDQLDLFGIRSIDPLEKKLVHQPPRRDCRHARDRRFGVGVLIRRVIERVKAKNGVLHLSFDVDFLDPAVAPGVGTTVPGGATYREAHLMMELLHDSDLCGRSTSSNSIRSSTNAAAPRARRSSWSAVCLVCKSPTGARRPMRCFPTAPEIDACARRYLT